MIFPYGRTNRRLILIFAGAVLLVPTASVWGTAWYYAGQIRSGALAVDHSPDKLDVRILEVSNTSILLGPGPDAGKNGTWTQDGVLGLEFEGGYAKLGPVVERNRDSVRRDLKLVSGKPAFGARARVDSFYFPGDPRSALDIDFSDVLVPAAVGPLPAWFVPGSRSTWVIFVHGKGSNRREGLRILPTLAAAGYPFLDITYRNDAEAAQDGYYAYGRTEWPDLEAAVSYAVGHGAAGVVLAGNSMGGSIVLSFIEQSPLAARVRALILDAPVIDFAATIDFQGKRRGLPAPLTGLAEWLASRRFQVNWHALDYRGVAQRSNVPVLLFHGEADQTVPVTTSDEFARARPGLVTYVRVAGAGHVRSWNFDPPAYDAAVTAFLDRVASSPATP